MRFRGFTLVELLVVMGIIALLAAVIMPVLAHTRKQAKSVVCQNQLRQLGLKLCVYETEYQVFPSGFYLTFSRPPEGFVGDARFDPAGWWWFNYLGMPYKTWEPEKNLLQCPGKTLNELLFEYNVLWSSYGINWSISKSQILWAPYDDYKGRPLGLRNIMHPAQTLLTMDSGYGVIGWQHTLPNDSPSALPSTSDAFGNSYIPGAAVNTERDLWPMQKDDAIKGRHPGRHINAVFTDGHLENRPADSVVVQENDDGSFTNLSLWKPQ